MNEEGKDGIKGWKNRNRRRKYRWHMRGSSTSKSRVKKMNGRNLGMQCWSGRVGQGIRKGSERWNVKDCSITEKKVLQKRKL